MLQGPCSMSSLVPQFLSLQFENRKIGDWEVEDFSLPWKSPINESLPGPPFNQSVIYPQSTKTHLFTSFTLSLHLSFSNQILRTGFKLGLSLASKNQKNIFVFSSREIYPA